MFKTLESVPLFKDVDPDILHLLEPLFEPYTCTTETIIFEQGQIAKYMYLLLEGSVEIHYKPYDGPPITITSLGEGRIFGWSAAIGNAIYTSGATCREDCRAIRMSSDDLHKLVIKEPEAGRIILNLLAESVSSRWDDAHTQIQSLLKTNVDAKQEAHVQMRRARKENR